MHFSAKCNSGRIAIQWFHIKHYLDYLYTNSSRIPFGCKKCVFLHDTRLWFPDYKVQIYNYKMEVAPDLLVPVHSGGIFFRSNHLSKFKTISQKCSS